MTLDQLRVFVAVAERQHVTQAAEALHLAQSAVSAQIAALEERHDARLFERVGRGIRLTETGAIFLVEAKAVLAQVDRAELVLAEIAGLRRGRLQIQASETIASYWLPSRLVAFRQANPGLKINLAIGNSSEAVEAVLAGRVELGFIEGAVDDPALVVTDLAQDQLVVVVAPDHPWAGRERLRPEEIAKSAWVLREPGSGTRGIFEADLARIGVAATALDIALETAAQRSGHLGGAGRPRRDCRICQCGCGGARGGATCQGGDGSPGTPFQSGAAEGPPAEPRRRGAAR